MDNKEINELINAKKILLSIKINFIEQNIKFNLFNIVSYFFKDIYGHFQKIIIIENDK